MFTFRPGSYSYVAIYPDGTVQTAGTLGKKEAIKALDDMILEEDSLARDWFPSDRESFPKLPVPIEDLVKKGIMVMPAAAAALNWMLKHCHGKIGSDKFLGWWFPVEKEDFIHT